ncbi:uncharacterized protein LOC126316929 isoform X2 [Schistocerca gregaria]|uniref:uncharacterized protein LOC126316929 isoform X2 n=1 Tax=Schistocerca gregaria TaxID=7010 RepID=UPI00211E6B38|nr:uncharacterized protein LOC126316929 isoform X2 [Schistocerca gregaria]
MIRVTKGIGKKVKLVVHASFAFRMSEFQTVLYDLIEDASMTQSFPGRIKQRWFNIERYNTQTPDLPVYSAELMIKLFKLSKQLMFSAIVDSRKREYPNSGAYRGKTVIFGTHNSGKQRPHKETSKEFFEHSEKFKQPKLSSDSKPDSRLGWSSFEDDNDESSLMQKQMSDVKAVWSSGSAPSGFSLTEERRMLESKIYSTICRLSARIQSEASKRESLVAVYLTTLWERDVAENLTMRIYKYNQLLKEEVMNITKPAGKVAFLCAEANGEYTGQYTLIVTSNGLAPRSINICTLNEYIVIYDFRKDACSIKLLPVAFTVSPKSNICLRKIFQIEKTQFLPAPLRQKAVHQTLNIDSDAYNLPQITVYSPNSLTHDAAPSTDPKTPSTDGRNLFQQTMPIPYQSTETSHPSLLLYATRPVQPEQPHLHHFIPENQHPVSFYTTPSHHYCIANDPTKGQSHLVPHFQLLALNEQVQPTPNSPVNAPVLNPFIQNGFKLVELCYNPPYVDYLPLCSAQHPAQIVYNNGLCNIPYGSNCEQTHAPSDASLPSKQGRTPHKPPAHQKR